nr:protein DOWNSTREAM OF FLC-like [Ipomoea batatas]
MEVAEVDPPTDVHAADPKRARLTGEKPGLADALAHGAFSLPEIFNMLFQMSPPLADFVNEKTNYVAGQAASGAVKLFARAMVDVSHRDQEIRELKEKVRYLEAQSFCSSDDVVAPLLQALHQDPVVSDKPFLVKGKVYLDTCNCGFETTATKYLPKSHVRLECKKRDSDAVTYTANAVTNSQGEYSILVNGDRGDDLCDVVLVKSSDPLSGKPDSGRDRARVILSRNNGLVNDVRFANNLGFTTKQPLASCAQHLHYANKAYLAKHRHGLPADKISEIDQPAGLVWLFFSIEKESAVCASHLQELELELSTLFWSTSKVLAPNIVRAQALEFQTLT